MPPILDKCRGGIMPPILDKCSPLSQCYLLTPPKKSKNSAVKNFPIDYIAHHNQALDTWEKAHKDGILKKGESYTLLHFDTHSDIRESGENKENEAISNFISNAVNKGWVHEIFWIVPDALDKIAGATVDSRYSKDEKVAVPAEIVIEGKNGKSIVVHILKMKDLPDFQNKKCLLDVDMDYFSNTGYDTADNFSNVPTIEELNKKLDEFTWTLKNRHLSPLIMTIARSPDYTQPEHIPIIEGYFKHHYNEHDYIPDEAQNYAHGNKQYYQKRYLCEALIKTLSYVENKEDPKDCFQTKADYMTLEAYQKELTTWGHPLISQGVQDFCYGQISKEMLIGIIRENNAAIQEQKGSP